MTDPLLRLAENLGIAGMMIYLLYRLVDKWASQAIDLGAKFLNSQEKQAKAIEDLAGSITHGQDEQRELLLAVRVLATKIDGIAALGERLDPVIEFIEGCKQQTRCVRGNNG